MADPQPGDTVFVLGEYQMGSIGIGDNRALVKVGEGFAVVPESAIVDTRPQPFPEHLAVVDKDDLLFACAMLEPAPYVSKQKAEEVLARLRTAAGEEAAVPGHWPPQPGDVWQDADNGQVWHATDRTGPLLLVTPGEGPVMSPDSFKGRERLVLRWRNDA